MSWVSPTEYIDPELFCFDSNHLKTRCMKTLFELNGIDIDVEPEEKWKNVFATLTDGDTSREIPYEKAMPKSDWQAFVKKIVQQVEDNLSSLDASYYEGTWVPLEPLFNSLQPAKVNETKWRRWMMSTAGNKPVIKTFEPNGRGYAGPVIYNRLGTRTGRLTVKEGPGILTLKKEARNIVASRYEGGTVKSIDFSALEVRVALYEAGRRCDDRDLYAALNKRLFNGTLARKAVKAAVISEIYGAGHGKLREILGASDGDVHKLTQRVKEYFRTPRLLKRVKRQFVKKGFITNKYGRTVRITEPMDHIILNSYVQSTGVDVSLLGFLQLVTAMPEGVVPIYILHDALVYDDGIGWEAPKFVKVPGYVQRFPLTVEQFAPEVLGSSEENEADE